MKEKLIEILYDFWSASDDDKEKLLEEIRENINDGITGAECLLDWCRCDYEVLKDQYRAMNKILKENNCNYGFMYYARELDKIWEICNLYLDYCNGTTSEKQLLELIEKL